MSILLDTHVLLWWLEDNPKLPSSVYQAIETAEKVYASVATLWEIAIKSSLNKLPNLLPEIHAIWSTQNIDLLPILFEHVEAVRLLPHHHRDPFDRMLIAQAQAEKLTFVTSDKSLAEYPVKTLWIES